MKNNAPPKTVLPGEPIPQPPLPPDEPLPSPPSPQPPPLPNDPNQPGPLVSLITSSGARLTQSS